MTCIDRDMQVGEALWILGVGDVKDVDAFMRETFKKAEILDKMPQMIRNTEITKKLEAIKTHLIENKMVVYDSFNRYSAQIITHTQGMLLLAKVLEILEGEG